MSETNNIASKLLDNDISFWEVDWQARSIYIEGNITNQLGIDKKQFSFYYFLKLIPQQYSTELKQHIEEDVEWSFPIQSNNNIQWIDVHKLRTFTSPDNHIHYLGSVRLMPPEEIGKQMLSGGINVRTCEPMLLSFTLMNKRETFNEGVQLLMRTLCTQLGGDRADIIHWNGNSNFQLFEYVGNPNVTSICDKAANGYTFRSKMLQHVCKTRQPLIIDEKHPLYTKWKAENEFFMRDNSKTIMIVPIVVGDKQPWGVLSFVSHKRSVLTNFDIQWISILSGRISMVIDRNEMSDKQDEQLRMMRQACEVGKLITWVWELNNDKEEIRIYSNHGLSNLALNINDIAQLIHKNDLNRFNKTVQAVLNGKLDKISIRLRIHSVVTGIMGWREFRAIIIRSDKGEIKRIIGASRDISDDIEHENGLKQEQQFQNTIYNKMPAGIEFFNEEGKLIYMNDTALNLLGIIGGRKSVVGINIFQNPNLTEDQRTEIKYAESAQYVISYDFRKAYFKSSRTDIIEMNYRMSKLYKHGKFVGYIVAMADNTEMIRQAKQISIFQRYFLEIGKFAKMGMCWFSDTKNGYVSEQWNINLGIKPDAPYMRNLSLLVHVVDEDLEVYGSLLGRIFVGDIDSFQYELRVNNDDGMIHYIKVQFVRSDEAVIGISLDVTQAKENEKMLIEAKMKAETADMLKLQFLENINHEIRTPLNAIVGFSDIIAQSSEANDMKMYADLIRSNNTLLLETIDDIIDLSKITSGTMEYIYSEADIDTLVNEVYERYNQLSHSKIEFICTTNDKGIKAYCETKQLKRILSNFVSNAFKFTATGRVELYYGINGNELIFNVIDTGCGISADKVNKIFDPYYKIDLFSVGTGLGLPICKGLAHDMGGYIEVFSTEGVGSHFRLHIPYVKTQKQPSAIQEESDDIMLLCNNNEIIQFTSYALNEYNLLVEQEHVFMSLWLEKNPKLTIIDQQMFGDSIAIVVSSLHNYMGNHKVIVLCPEGLTIDKDSITQAGAETIISLPITRDKFKSIVSTYVKKRSQKIRDINEEQNDDKNTTTN